LQFPDAALVADRRQPAVFPRRTTKSRPNRRVSRRPTKTRGITCLSTRTRPWEGGPIQAVHIRYCPCACRPRTEVFCVRDAANPAARRSAGFPCPARPLELESSPGSWPALGGKCTTPAETARPRQPFWGRAWTGPPKSVDSISRTTGSTRPPPRNDFFHLVQKAASSPPGVR